MRPPARGPTIRTRLALIYTGLLVAALAVFGSGVYLVLRTELERSFDASLTANAEHAAGAFAQDVGPDGILRPTTRLLEQFASTGGRILVLAPDGSVIADSAGTGAAPVPVATRDLIAAGRRQQVVEQTALGPEVVRLIVDPVHSPARDPAGYVVWANSTRELDALLRTVALALALGGLLVTALAFAGGWLLARRALAPVARVTETARSISLSGDFGARVDPGRRGDEVGELAVAFNEMLAALEANHQALQRFLGDASHELRTPLTTIRASLDLAQRTDVDPQVRAAILDDARAEAERMSRLVGDLLSLARAESGARLESAPVELDAVLLETVRQASQAASHVRMDVERIEPAVVHGDRDRLKELLLIVLDNAARYTPDGGRVSLGLQVAGGETRITISDTGIGISESERSRVFERLYRGARARTLRPSGTGLGLAIARWIVEAHGGRIALGARPEGGTTVTITLPATMP